MSTIDDLERKVQSLQDKLSAASKALYEARVAACPVKKGDLVRYRGLDSRKQGQIYKVTGIDVAWGIEHPWLRGAPQRKDGSFGTAERHLYGDWEKVAR